MMGFLAPWALAGLTLLAVPIAIHLLKPRQVKRTPFTSLRWLKASEHRLSRRMKWHQLLLFFLRAGLLAALVLALARPYIAPGESREATDRIVVVDLSRSMAYAAEDEPSPLERGKRIAQTLLTHGGPGDRATLILAGSRPMSLGPLTADASRYLPRLRTAVASTSDANLGGALRLVAHYLPADAERRRELVVITDSRATTWNASEIRRMVKLAGPALEVNVVRVAASSYENALVADARLITSVERRRRAIRVRVEGTGAGEQRRTVRLDSVRGLPSLSQPVTVRAGSGANVEFPLPADLDLAGQVARVELRPADRLASDDHYLLNLDKTAAARVLLISEASSELAELRSTFNLAAALESLSDAAPGTLDVVLRDTSVPVGEIRQAQAIVLVDVLRLSDPQAAALAKQVEGGAGLAVFLGPSIDAPFYNSSLRNALDPSRPLLGLVIGERAESPRADRHLAPLADVRWDHALFARLADPIYSDLAATGFKTWYSLRPSDGGAESLATIAGGAAAILESRSGAGRVIVFNTSANDATSDLARRKSFVPLVDRMLDLLVPVAHGAAVAVGEPIWLPVPRPPAEQYRIRSPSGRSLVPQVRMLGNRQMLHLAGAEEGIYWVEEHPSGRRVFPLVVQTRGNAGSLSPLADATLRQWWRGSKFDVINANDVDAKNVEALPALTSSVVWLDPWLVLAACLLLIGEMALVHRLCPRRNPPVVTRSGVAGTDLLTGETPAGDGVRKHDRPRAHEPAIPLAE